MLVQVVATGCLGWYVLIATITTLGTVQIFRHYRRPPRKPISSHLDLGDVPHVTIIRPCKGLEPYLYDCLTGTFHQDYPINRLTVYFCVASKDDAAYQVLEKIVTDFSHYDTKIFVEEEDPLLQGTEGQNFGPNPKIRNMSRSWREAKGDIVWILDCNIWMGFGALGRMVDKLCGFALSSSTAKQAQTKKPYKLVAHLPVCVDVDGMATVDSRNRAISASASDNTSTVPFMSSRSTPNASLSSSISSSSSSIRPAPATASSALTGSKLETSFLSTAHAKMYVAINSVSIAPCINGKSTMFRKSHLNNLTKDQGIDFFSHNICEDHLIGDLLWKSRIASTLGFDSSNGEEIRRSNPNGYKYRNHGLAMGDLAIQPISQMSIASYIARRVRWLRVRKFTVMIATLVEPGTESLVCCAMGAFGVTTVPRVSSVFGNTWLSTVQWFAVGFGLWCAVDWFVSGIILRMGSVEKKRAIVASEQTRPSRIVIPAFAKPIHRRAWVWLKSWFGRECLALPIWTWAIWGGTTVTWRERKFWVGIDMRVHEMPESAAESTKKPQNHANGSSMSGSKPGESQQAYGTMP